MHKLYKLLTASLLLLSCSDIARDDKLKYCARYEERLVRSDDNKSINIIYEKQIVCVRWEYY